MDASNSSTPHGAALPRTPLGVRPQRALGNGKSVDTPRIMRLRKLVLFSGQAFIILCITFALAEVALRIYNSIKPLPIFYSTSYNRFRGKPFSSDYDSFHLNSRGFKDVEHNAQKAAGTFRNPGNRRLFCLWCCSLHEQLANSVERQTESQREASRAYKHGDPRY